MFLKQTWRVLFDQPYDFMYIIQLSLLLFASLGESAVAALPILMYGKENGDSIATKELVI